MKIGNWGVQGRSGRYVFRKRRHAEAFAERRCLRGMGEQLVLKRVKGDWQRYCEYYDCSKGAKACGRKSAR